MSLIRRALMGGEQRDVTLEELLTKLRGHPTTAGVHVDKEQALRHSAVWACQRLLSDTVAGLPLHAYVREDDRRRKLPVQPVVVESPSGVISRPEWLSQAMASLLGSGNAIGVVATRDQRQIPQSVELVRPERVTCSRRGHGLPDYRIDGSPVARGDVMHITAFTLPGEVWGLSPIDYARQTVGLGLAAERFGAGWFGEGGHPTAVLQSDQGIDTPTAATIKQRFLDAIRGGGIAVLGAGLKYERVQLSPEEAQFIDTQKWTVLQVARFYGVPPEMIGAATDGSSVTYANREQRALDFVTFGLSPWLVRIETAFTRLFRSAGLDWFAKFNVDALLRSDTATRYRAHDSAIRAGWLNRNEIRTTEDLEPIDEPDGDAYLWPPYRAFPLDSDEEKNT